MNDYYNAHKAEFNLIEPQYHIAQIFVTTQPNAQVHNLQNNKAQNEPDARKKIQMINNRLDSGDDFATLAMNYSEDPETAGSGGDLGFTPESSLKNTDPQTRDVGDEAQARTVQPSDYACESRDQTGIRLSYCEAARERAGRTAGPERSQSATSDSPANAGSARATSEGGVL